MSGWTKERGKSDDNKVDDTFQSAEFDLGWTLDSWSGWTKKLCMSDDNKVDDTDPEV